MKQTKASVGGFSKDNQEGGLLMLERKITLKEFTDLEAGEGYVLQ